MRGVGKQIASDLLFKQDGRVRQRMHRIGIFTGKLQFMKYGYRVLDTWYLNMNVSIGNKGTDPSIKPCHKDSAVRGAYWFPWRCLLGIKPSTTIWECTKPLWLMYKNYTQYNWRRIRNGHFFQSKKDIKITLVYFMNWNIYSIVASFIFPDADRIEIFVCFYFNCIVVLHQNCYRNSKIRSSGINAHASHEWL